MGSKKRKKINWKKLRKEYADLCNAEANMLSWCSTKAAECRMSYGVFVQKLGR